jgi:hypothetical protein
LSMKSVLAPCALSVISTCAHMPLCCQLHVPLLSSLHARPWAVSMPSSHYLFGQLLRLSRLCATLPQGPTGQQSLHCQRPEELPVF